MRLEKYRLMFLLSRRKVAKLIGVRVWTYRKYEKSNGRDMPVKYIFILMRYYGVSFEELIGETMDEYFLRSLAFELKKHVVL